MTKERPSYEDLELKIAQLEAEKNATNRYVNSIGKIYNSISTGVVIINAETHIIENANDAVLSILGYSTKDELLGKTCYSCFCPQKKHDCPITEDNPEIMYTEKKIKRKDGTIIPVMKEVTTITTLDKQKYIIENFHDISEKKLLENQLNHAKNLAILGERTERFIHDLNNPLTGFMGGFQMMDLVISELPDIPQKKEMEQMLKISNKGFDIIYSMVKNLLTYIRDSHETEVTQINLKHDLEASIEIAKLDQSYKNLHKDTYYDLQEVPMIKGIPSHFQQIFNNLIQNATHAIEDAENTGIITPNQTSKLFIQLSYLENKEAINFIIKDSGIGIPQEKLGKIFEPHYTTKTNGRGTGLGLASVAETVKMYGGEITVESQPNKGATFNIVIPVNQR